MAKAISSPIPDLFEQFREMTPQQLAPYAQAFNIFVRDISGKEGILIGHLDQETNRKDTVKILRDGDFHYPTPEQLSYVRAERRKF